MKRLLLFALPLVFTSCSNLPPEQNAKLIDAGIDIAHRVIVGK